VEPASIDEAYLDMTGTERLYHHEPLATTAARIQAAVLAETNIQVSLGGGTNRLVAKLAVSRAKPAGVHIVPAGGESAFLAEHDIADIPGVGPVLAKELMRYGLKRVSDALELTERQLAAVAGERRGGWLHRRLRGIDDSVVAVDRAARSLSRDETFARDIHDDAELDRHLRALIRRLASDLRSDGIRARTITVRIRDADFRTRQASRTVPEGVETDGAIHALARPLLARLRADRRTPARLLGVAASNLEDGTGTQVGLFDSDMRGLETERDRRLARAADQVRSRYGRDAIAPGDLMDSDA
jgi:DNA polymerase-4